jgi:hypothetical protein
LKYCIANSTKPSFDLVVAPLINSHPSLNVI